MYLLHLLQVAVQVDQDMYRARHARSSSSSVAFSRCGLIETVLLCCMVLLYPSTSVCTLHVRYIHIQIVALVCDVYILGSRHLI